MLKITEGIFPYVNGNDIQYVENNSSLGYFM